MMKSSRKSWIRIAAMTCCLVTSVSSIAQPTYTAEGVRHVSGGVGQDERAKLHAVRGQYNLWITAVAKPSGAYLSDATVEIRDMVNDRVVLSDVMAGPWLLADLPAGKYRVGATLRLDSGRTESKTKDVIVEPGILRQVVLRFHSDAQVSDQRTVQFGGNPFSEPLR